jgi:hypothetical protein
MIKFEDVKNQTTEEYFNGNQFSIDAFNKKYALFEGESYVNALKRICDYIASVETTKELQKYWSERWFDEIYQGWWHPAGSIMQGAGCGRKISLANCTALGFGVLNHDEEWDSLEGIIKNTTYTVAKMAAYRQGLGVDFSRLRPVGTKVLNSSSESQGVVHWMSLIDSIGYYVGQKGRRPAMLFSLNCFEKNVLIKTNVGYLTIKNIIDNFSKYTKEGLQIWTENGFQLLIGCNTKDNQDIYEVTTEDGQKIKVTADHEFEVKNIKTNKIYLKKIIDLNPDEEELILFKF